VTVSQWIYGLMVVTLEPDRVAPAVLSSIDVVIAIGKQPAEMLCNDCTRRWQGGASVVGLCSTKASELCRDFHAGKIPILFSVSQCASGTSGT
jgi:hypothetical protein